MRRRFVTLDVFTDRRFAGNPLAVVIDADGLDTKTMQMIAREFNHPETVFVLTPTGPEHRARVRIFTPATELPFAGHPTVGTAVLLGLVDGGTHARDILVEEGIGPVRCCVRPVERDRGRARFDLAKLPQELGLTADVAIIAAALGIEAGDVGFDQFAPARWSAGLPVTFVPLKGLDIVRRCQPDLTKWGAAFESGGGTPVYVFTRETASTDHAFHARMFAPDFGIPEDPATGAAVAALAGPIARCERLRDGNHDFIIEQGFEMGRQSLIELALTVRDGQLAAGAIGGWAVVVTEGEIET